MAETMSRNRELVLPPGQYAYVLDTTKGRVGVAVGPYKSSLSETDQLVVWDSVKMRYTPTENSAEVAQRGFTVAEQGQYIVLTNPAASPMTTASEHPPVGTPTDAAPLDVGRRIVIPGPAAFPLWPGQTAEVIDGHHLRHNQYVIVRVYDDQLAHENWTSTVMAATQKADDDEGAAVTDILAGAAPQFTMGQLIVVPGTQVSFYMPSTGMEVVPEGGTVDPHGKMHGGRYIRDAVTLETLDYCILIDENGQKRYERGPAVIFPQPTETFKVNDNNSRIFDAIELNEQSGLYVKVIEEYIEDGQSHHVGEELFITGKEQAIYFPRAEHSVITYGGKRKHHSIAVPAGEGRYVLDRTSGNVVLHRGPTMLLPDPRTEVIVRRILDPHDVETMFPGNDEALMINALYAEQRDEATSGYLENAEALRGAKSKSLTSRGQRARYAANETPVISSYAGTADPQNFMGDTLSRATQYSPPRTITLDTKYEGAVAISIFPGYAVLVTDKTGQRRVEVGPKVVLLGYDETIMALSLSTGRPKTDTNLLCTGYLRVINNVVTDIVNVETRDLVALDIEVSYRVNFTGETDEECEKWFSIENYVQVLTDHCRSRLRNTAKQHDILDFYTNAIDIIRDTILGTIDATSNRALMTFEENGMQVYDVEVLAVHIENDSVEKLLTGAQSAALEGAIELSIAEEASNRDIRLAELQRKALQESQITAKLTAEIGLAEVTRVIERQLAQAAGDLSVRTERLTVEEKALEGLKREADVNLAIRQEIDTAEIARLTAETDETVKRINAFGPGMIEALTAFGDHALVEKIVQAIGPAALASGVTTADMLNQLFKDTPLAGVMQTLASRPLVASRQTTNA